jgi:hypothetical protein
MSQTGYTPISLYYSATASAAPVAGNLVAGELAINTNDGKLYYKDSAGVVQTLASKSATAGTYSSITVTGGSINGTTIGATTASTGAFTTLSASSTVSGTGFSTYLASPPAIGGTAAASGSFTTLSASSTVTLSGGTANGVGYLNGSKVLTTGSALTFDGTNLGVSAGNINLGNAYFLNGRNSANTGYVPIVKVAAGDILEFGSGGYNANFTGSVGIGTSSPKTKFQASSAANAPFPTLGTASGTAYFTNNDASYGMLVGSTSAGSTWIQVQRTDLTATAYDLILQPSGGNLGLGVTPSAWGSGYKALQVGLYSGLAYEGGKTLITTNAYNNGTNWLYANSDYASRYQQQGSQHQWYTAASGTAGNAITFTQAMTLDASANLLLNSTTNGNSAKMKIGGGARTVKFFDLEAQGGENWIIDSTNTSGSTDVFGIYAAGATGVYVTDTGIFGVGTTSPSANTKIDASGPIRAGGYTVATLPTGVVGARAYVTDAVTAVFMATPTGGGSVKTPVFFNGSVWVCG